MRSSSIQMADKTIFITQPLPKSIKIQKWKVSEGSTVSIGRVILLYDFEGAANKERKLKSTYAGTVHKIIAQEGAVVRPGQKLFELKSCIHPTVMKDMCAECGADLRKDDLSMTASVPMVHSIPELKVSEELAQKLGKADNERLLKDRKLVLLVDLDQTLIHTTNDNIPPNIKDVYHFQLYGPHSPWYHTRLRPGTHNFLKNVDPYFELHICTFGARNYAHMITMFLDADQKYFSNRILSRDECFDPTSKKANLKALFPCGDNMVCIIDDREDVWSHASNLIHVKPYHFFQHTGDINAPPGLDKHENDEKEGVDLTKLANTVKKQETHVIEKDAKNNKETKEDNDVVEKLEENEVKIDNEIKESCNGTKTDEKKETIISVEPVNNGDNKLKDSEAKENDKEANHDTETKENSCQKEASQNPEEELIEVDDPDDYLLHLEDILKRIHKAFFDLYDKMESGEVPDLKTVIPKVRSCVLKGTKLVFSGLVPTHIKLNQSKAYQVARSLGAEVTQDLEDDTTHLVAVRPGTAKVNAGRRKKNLKIVTPDWLWACAEAWEHCDERVFPLSSKGSRNRHPPPHCSSPEHVPNYPTHDTPAMRKRTPSGRFMDTINPLMSFSSADIADMDKEVDNILDDESDSDEETEGSPVEKDPSQMDISRIVNEDDSSSSAESLTAEYPRGYKRRRANPELLEDDLMDSSVDEFPSTKFRRGQQLESDLDFGQNSNSEGSDEPQDEVDDGEWNMMGAALEREFLSNN